MASLSPSLQVEEILRKTDLMDRASVESAVIECGLYIGDEVPSGLDRMSAGVRALQMPNQLAPFLIYLNRFTIRTYLDVGAYFGGTFYIIDTYLRLTQPKYRIGYALDPYNQLRDFQSYQSMHPSTRFIETRSIDYVPEQMFDLVFVDGDHSYEYLCQEFIHLWQYARLMAFHDVVSNHYMCPGTKRFWQCIRSKFVAQEFIDQYDGMSGVMGIGVIQLAGDIDRSVPAQEALNAT